MTMPWFRMYHESRNDRKLDTLTDDEFRVWHRLLCFASESTERGTVAADDRLLLAIEVARGDEELLARTVKRLVALRIVSDNGEVIAFLNFIKRNYDKPSDTPQATAERKRKQREKERESAGQGRDEGVTQHLSRDVTPSHAIDKTIGEENKLEERENTPPIPPAPPPRPAAPPHGGGRVRAAPKPATLDADQRRDFEEWYRRYPNKQHRPEAERAWRKLNPDDELVDRLIADIAARKLGRKWSEGYIEHPATYLNNRVWEDDIEPVRLAPSARSPDLQIVNGVSLSPRMARNVRVAQETEL